MNKHFHLQQDEYGIAWLTFDSPGKAANVLTGEALEEFDTQLVTIAQSHPKGLVIQSGKKNGFIAGADVKAFARIGSPQEAQALILRVHDIFRRLEALSFPTVALIHGFCLGGGLELALACRYRIASTDPTTRLGFPEVRLGIFPGFGGTWRSTRLLGHTQAMALMLSGRNLVAKQAKSMGLVDHALPQRQLKNAARHLIREQPPGRKPSFRQRLPGSTPLRPIMANIFRRQVRKQAGKEHYPAPYALIDHWRKHANHAADMYASEARRVPELLTGKTARNLIRLFLLQDDLKNLAADSDFRAHHVHVIGGGVMGGDIAAWCVLRGMRVTLQDRGPEQLGRAVRRARQLFQRKLRDRYRIQEAMDRFIPDHQGNGLGKADVVIEAIFEDPAAKQALFKDIEPHMKKDAILASNTSSIPLQQLGAGLVDPKRIIGLHFFNPVARMPLVEIVTTHETPPDLARDANGFVRRIGKLPLPVRSEPGFLVNRVLMPYLMEAVILLDEGVPATDIDRAARNFGMPMGPVELADTVGLDICLSVAEKLSTLLHGKVPGNLQALVEQEQLGRKTGRGFYEWSKGKPRREKSTTEPDVLEHYSDRMILRLINESVACLHEGIVADADKVDAGVVFGTGFAPFRGGPLHYVREQGPDRFFSKLQKLEYTYGERFAPDSGWEEFLKES
ncbi:3-hydroxyacyl-CoA dehydrogenase NAD-binding domain-containing protein [Thiolapillus brandeum]|uniref:enoyl-CoA hydratase n=1 Tax=Thiolapillus brandeum TaxID=1076588 RepID=A0A7U6JIY6_9GAMM|nr:3-hydroxyacyl-CoA dehydrogenase NAD-binding domain-containing protein [Thiolapillus brandeum]BAO44665.1 3-hydroxyacyl-CoA dehydrogenase / enoyl-CoA hydratase / 3-hydroxybutyryl-CoA epimerase [Thiolapillus brandeum]